MAFRTEKNGEDTDIVIDGWDQGIAPSPHKGIANIQNANISTELGEVASSFVRQQQSITDTAATGTLAYFSTDHVTLSIPNSNNLFKGNWITVTNSSNTGELPNGTYYVPPSTGSNFQLANYYQVSATEVQSGSFQVLVVAGGGGGGTANGSSTTGGGGGAGGVVYSAATTLTRRGYAVTVGAGGLAGTSGTLLQGTNGGDSTFDGTTATGGGGGGGASTTSDGNVYTGANGGSGGGGGKHNTTTSPGGTGIGGQGNNGGTTPTSNYSSGGGGASAVGTAGTASAAGNGGNGYTTSISGTSTTYGGGGGGGDNASGGAGGTGGGGAGGNGGAGSAHNGTAGTANTGGGGGGAGTNGSGTGSGAAGGSGIVIISATIGVVTNASTAAVGGTHTTSGGNDIWTFTSTSGGSFFPTFASVPAPTNILSGFTAGLTATIQLAATMGKPLAKATENYFRSGTEYNRYYILDDQNLVWVYDTYNETLYSSSDNVSWFLPDYKTNWCTSASGIGVIDGFLIATAQSGIYGKEVAMLGGINTQTSNWTQFSNNIQWNGGATDAPHFCYVGHQGYLYITDGNYIRSIFPDATLASSSVASTGDNVQSFASWTVDGGAATPTKGIPSPISGGQAITSDDLPLPVVFTTTGTLPNSINANTVYYLYTSQSTGEFTVWPDPTMATSISEPTTTGTLSAGVTTATLSANWTYPTGIYYTGFNYSGGTEYHNVLFTNGSTAIIWGTVLANATTSTTLIVTGFDLSTGAAGTQYYNTFYPLSSNSDYQNSTTPTFVLSNQRLVLPNFEVAQCMAEIGNTVIIGCAGNVAYPWDQVSNLPGTIISLPESDVQWIITVNQIAYLAAGNQGNIYLTDGSLASLVINIPDYVAGVPGSPGTYIESTYAWTDAMYLRGRVYFGLIDQSSTKAGNCGGIWSFVPTQNLYLGQDTGIAIRLESQNSYNTYSGGSLLLINRVNQNAQQPLYWSAWESDITSPTYGIDYSTGGTSASFPFVVETDALPVGTMLNKKTFSQVEYKLSSPLDAGATVQVYARSDLTGTWTSMGTVNTETSALSGYFPINFQTNQWLQLRIVLTPITSSASSNSFVRLKEIRIR